MFDMETDFAETTDIAARNPQIVEKMAGIYEQWSDSCRNSFDGNDYNVDEYTPSGSYRENGGLRIKTEKQKKDKAQKKANRKNGGKSE